MKEKPSIDESLKTRVRQLMGSVILISQSVNRLETLLECGVSVKTCPQDTPEDSTGLTEPEEIVRHIAYEKMESYLRCPSFRPQELAIALDTMVSFEGKMLGKPHDAQEARMMLSSFSGKRQLVVTGFVLYVPSHGLITSSDRSSVLFSRLCDEEIENYINSGEWKGAAGGYRIQKTGWKLIDSISGSWSNVIGLPLEAVVRQLEAYT